jgi:peroxiredoxin
MGLSRRSFGLGLLAGAALAADGRFVRSVARADGARSGGWCRPLTTEAQSAIYDFTLEVLDRQGATISLADLRGQAVWLNFFASWCGPCRREARDIQTMATKYHDDGLRVVGVDIGEAPHHAREFRDSFGLTYPIALDHTESVYKAFGYNVLPMHMFFDATGLLTCVSVGDLSYAEMDNEVSVALVGLQRNGTRLAAKRVDGTPYVAPTNTPHPTDTPDSTPSTM